eukprot:GHVS01070452.1.p1 GENE.GHVS01070452.1~~GHVS01070452.1.p1  ORF type:complete len:116 (+),score=11.98 GHVS01070452.1:139-486(+)
MVLLVLHMKADLENVDRVEIILNRTTWCFDVKQTSSEEKRLGVTFNAGANLEIPNSRGTADFLLRWEGAKHHSTLTVTEVGEIRCSFVPFPCFSFSSYTLVTCVARKGERCHSQL